MKQEWKITKKIHYSDPVNEDFNDVGLKRSAIPSGYKYSKFGFSRFIGNCLYYLLAKPILSIGCFFNGVRIKNRKQLKILRKQKTGVFLYGNHVAIMDVFKLQTFAIHRKTNIIGFTDTLSLGPIVRYLVKCFGYFPLPLENDFANYRNLENALALSIKRKENVIIFPEAHIWPYYTKIRDFKNGSFHYPAKLNAPIMPFVTVWRKVWYRKRPCQTIIFGELVYPKQEFSIHENRDYLHSECLKQMKNIANSVNQYEYIEYIYDPNGGK